METNKIQTISLLKELAEMAEHGALTGMNGNTAKRAVARYNALLEKLVTQGLAPSDLFSRLPDDAGFGDLLVDARLLVSYLKENQEDRNLGEGNAKHFSPDKHLIVRLAPFANSEDLKVMVEACLAKGEAIDPHFLESMAPFLDRDHLGMLIRKIAGQAGSAEAASGKSEAPVPPVPPMPPAPPAPPVGIDSSAKIEVHDMANKPVEDIPIQVRIDLIAERMRAADTTLEEMQELSAEMIRLKRERGRQGDGERE
jgi:hypothetical protein